MLDALVGVSKAWSDVLTANGQAAPAAQRIRALLDTGASCTCIDPSVMTALGLTPTGRIQINTPSTGATPHMADQYDVGIAIPPGVPSHPSLIFPTVAVTASHLLATQGFHALIGRDILRGCLLTYNGTTGTFTLAY